MRTDQLYNLGGFDPDHPSGNVLDEFQHRGACSTEGPCTCETVVAKSYDHDGSVLADARLTTAERNFFYPDPDHPPTQVEVDAVRALADVSIRQRVKDRLDSLAGKAPTVLTEAELIAIAMALEASEAIRLEMPEPESDIDAP